MDRIYLSNGTLLSVYPARTIFDETGIGKVFFSLAYWVRVSVKFFLINLTGMGMGMKMLHPTCFVPVDTPGQKGCFLGKKCRNLGNRKLLSA